MNRTVTGNSKRFESHKTSSVAAIKRDTSEQDTKLLRWLYTSHFNSFLFLFPFLFLQTFPWHFFSMAMHLNFALFFFPSPREEEETEKVAFLLFKSVWKFWPAAMPPCFLRPSFPPLTTIPSSDSLCSWLLPLSTAPLCSSACVPASPPPPFHPL